MHKENQMPARDDCLMRRWRNKSVVVGSGWSAVMNGLKSRSGWSHYLFVSPYTCLDMTFHNVPPPPPPSLGGSHGCVPMHVLSRCRRFVPVCAPVRMSRRWCHFSFWLNSCASAIAHPLPISLQTPLGFDLSVECMHTHTSRAHVCNTSRWWMALLPAVLRGRKVLKRTKTLDCLCFIIKN